MSSHSESRLQSGELAKIIELAHSTVKSDRHNPISAIITATNKTTPATLQNGKQMCRMVSPIVIIVSMLLYQTASCKFHSMLTGICIASGNWWLASDLVHGCLIACLDHFPLVGLCIDATYHITIIITTTAINPLYYCSLGSAEPLFEVKIIAKKHTMSQWDSPCSAIVTCLRTY